jgi:UTP-glucose-1-phosphate uridylyltransferase
MEFDGDALEVTEIPCGADLHFIITDLKGHKDTVKILADLNKAFPFAENDIERNVQEYLGPMNRRILGEAAEALKRGEAARLGELMNEAQALFDRFVAPACPDQLASPILHRVLSSKSLAPYIYGGKGVGSQGDGSAQFIARDAESREAAIEVLEKELGLPCLRLTVARSRKVRKAVITAAGFGTRLFPMTAAVRKEFLPVVDSNGRMIPLILANVEEAIAAGIEAICIIVREADQPLFADFFRQNLPQEHYEKLSESSRETCSKIREIGKKVSFTTQANQRGLGHAVQQARTWVGNEPFLLLLGDHLFLQHGDTPCAKQLVDHFQELETNLVGLQATPESELGRFGTVGGAWVKSEDKPRHTLLEISQFKEKPDPEFAAEYLAVDGLPARSYLTLFGLYILKPAVFAKLERLEEESAMNTEVQLTDALEALRKTERFLGLVISGEKIDIGLPTGYIDGLVKYHDSR